MAASAQGSTRLLAVRAAGRRFGLPAASVREVALIPKLTSVPHAPACLLGIGNVRGEPHAIVSAAQLLGTGDSSPRQMAILEGKHPAALAIDEVEGVVEADAALEQPDFGTLLADAFPDRTSKQGRARSARSSGRKAAADAERLALLAFAIGNQIFALPAEDVEAVLLMPDDIALMPNADAVTVGTVAYRSGVLALFSLAALLALPGNGGKASRILVVRIGRHRVGLVVDGMRALLRPTTDSIDPVPASLLRGEVETVIQSIYRPANGGQLVSILAAGQLLREDLTAQIKVTSAANEDVALIENVEMTALLLFEIAGHRFACPLDAIQQVARVPAHVTPLPNVPSFINGVAAFRGDALVLVDLAAHLSERRDKVEKGRVLLADVSGKRVALLVDQVIGIRHVANDAIDAAPALGDKRTAQFDRVVTLDKGETATLLLSPAELFDQIEANLIAEIADRSVPAA